MFYDSVCLKSPYRIQIVDGGFAFRTASFRIKKSQISVGVWSCKMLLLRLLLSEFARVLTQCSPLIFA